MSNKKLDTIIEDWLDSKIDDDNIKSIYDSDELSIKPTKKYTFESINKYNKYYTDNDTDITSSNNMRKNDIDFITIINDAKKYDENHKLNESDNFCECDDSKELSFKNNDKLQSLDNYVERYVSNDVILSGKFDKEKQEEKEVLIPPSTNRYHANYLFKKLVDYAYNNNYSYNIYDKKTGKYINMHVFDKDMKSPFYEFCFSKTSKNI